MFYTNSRLALAKYVDGDLDTTFSDDGMHVENLADSSWEITNAVAITANGKIVTAGALGVSGSTRFIIARHDSKGVLDKTFADDGIRRIDVPNHATAGASSLAIDANGRIVAAGDAAIAEFTGAPGVILPQYRSRFAVVRCSPGGDLDGTFGNGGTRVINFFGSRSEAANSVAIAADGKIVTAGYAYLGDRRTSALAQLTPQGDYDEDFGDKCRVITDTMGTDNAINAVAIDANGKIVTAGYAVIGAGRRFAMGRYNPNNGDLDSWFTTNLPGSTDEVVNAMAIDANGKIVVAGYATINSRRYFALARYNPNGTLDTSFTNDAGTTKGWVAINFHGSTDDEANAVAIDANGKIVAAGYATVGGHARFALARLNPDGTRDKTFSDDDDGRLTTKLPDSVAQRAQGVDVYTNGRIVSVGWAVDEQEGPH